eukprot:c41838_g1_i1 orf=2-250(-)
MAGSLPPLSPSSSFNKRINRSGLAVHSTPVMKNSTDLNHFASPIQTDPNSFQMTVGTESCSAIMDGQADPFFPASRNTLATPL